MCKERFAGRGRCAPIFWIFAITSCAIAQQPESTYERSAGTSYYVVFPDTAATAPDTVPAFDGRDAHCYLVIYSASSNSVVIRGSDYERTVSLDAGTFAAVDLLDSARPAAHPIVTSAGPATDGVFHVEARKPIILYQFMSTRFGTEAWMPLPVEAWSNEYYPATVSGDVGRFVSSASDSQRAMRCVPLPAEILVISAYDHTRISVITRSAGSDSLSRVDTVLQTGEVFLVQSRVDTASGSVGQPTFDGTRVFADKPVGILGGNSRSRGCDGCGSGVTGNTSKNLLMEWFAPPDFFGTEFVYLPTWDDRRPNGADTGLHRTVEFLHITKRAWSALDVSVSDSTGAFVPLASFARDSFGVAALYPDRARVIRTSANAQMIVRSPGLAVLRDSSAGSVDYATSGPYTVELVPRDHWVDVAPVYTPSEPNDLRHYLNVATDSAHRADVIIDGKGAFDFNHGVIPGTDIVWGTMEVPAGTAWVLSGHNGARFTGTVYGGREGREIMTSTRGYEERTAAAYGVALAPMRTVAHAPDSLVFETQQCCCEFLLDVQDISESPVGIRTIYLDDAANAQLRYSNPYPITGAVKARAEIRPVDYRRDAHATVVVTDRSGASWRLPYVDYAEIMAADPVEVDFGAAAVGEVRVRDVAITNESSVALGIYHMKLAQGAFFSITSAPATGFDLDTAGRFLVQLNCRPATWQAEYLDTLVVASGCDSVRVPLRARSASGAEEASGTAGTDLTIIQPTFIGTDAVIRFTLTSAVHVELALYDLTGRRVAPIRDGYTGAGTHSIRFDASALASGVYVCRLVLPGSVVTRRVMFAR